METKDSYLLPLSLRLSAQRWIFVCFFVGFLFASLTSRTHFGESLEKLSTEVGGAEHVDEEVDGVVQLRH